MKLLDVVNQLRVLLPIYTNRMSNQLTVSSIVASGGVATITSAGHGLVTGDVVTLAGVLSQTPIDAVAKLGNIVTFGTAAAHDLTETWSENVTLSGFTDASWNDTFSLTSANSRQTFQVTTTLAEPILNGSEVLLENRVDGANGAYSATVTGADTFTISGDIADGTYIGGTVHTFIRVAGAVNFERALKQYTEQNLTSVWAFVVMHDTEVSKDRNTYSDAIATPGNGVDLRLRMMDGFSIYLLANVSTDMAAQRAIDLCRHDLMGPILHSIYGARFTTGLSSAPDFKTIFTGHGTAFYDVARYAHVYNFQTTMDLTESDAVQPFNTRAFRNVDYTQESTVGDDELAVNIDLDDNPIMPT